MKLGLSNICLAAFLALVFIQTANGQIVSAERGGGSTEDLPMVAPGGLGEDALSFVDRDHEYNEVPDFLVGADYVMVANDDKTTADYSLDVTLGSAANLFLIIDSRVGDDDNTTPPDLTQAMQWVLEMGFVNTGRTVGIDEGGDGDVDQFSWVFVRPVEAETVTLLEQDNTGSRNMYGVAAVPRVAKPVPAQSDLGLALLIAMLLGGGALAMRKVAVAC